MRLPSPLKMTRPALVVVLLLVLVVLPAPRAAAQASKLDRSRMIEGLAGRHMSELLGHYLDQVQDQLDPIDEAQLRIQQALMAYRDKADSDDPELQAQAADDFAQAVALRTALINDHPEHMMAAIWATDLAEMLLITQLKSVGAEADLFYEFGVPTGEQRTMFDRAVAQAYTSAAGADERFDQLTGLLGRKPEVRDELEATGLIFKIDQYRDVRLPYFMAQAAYLLSLQPDDSAYFAAQNRAARLERQRLRGDALDRIEPLAGDAADPYGIRDSARVLAGRIMAAMGDADEGIDTMLNPVITQGSPQGAALTFLAQLSKAAAGRDAGDFELAAESLDDLADSPLLNQSSLYRLLLADAEHRLILAEVAKAPTKQRAALRAAAYEPYLAYLDTLSPGPERQNMRGFIFNRWAQTLPPDADPKTYPPMVRMALVEIGSAQAAQAVADGRFEDARTRFNRAITIGRTLTDPDIDDATRAQGMFSLAAAIYQRETMEDSNQAPGSTGEASGGQDLGAMLEVIDLMTTVADEMPDQPVAETAMGAAMQFARQLHELTPRPPGTDAAYAKATDVLFARYDDTPIADDQRIYFAQTILQAKGRFADAAAVYDRVPFNSPDFFLAQQLKIQCLEDAWRQAVAQETGQAEAADALRKQADALYRDAIAEADRASDPTREQEAVQAAGAARLALASLAIGAGQTDVALELLDGFETEFEDDPDLVPLALEKRILTLVSADRLDEAAQAARAMMARYPQVAAAVVSQVLDRLETEIDQLVLAARSTQRDTQRRAFEDKAAQRAATAVKLAQVLLDWARDQDLDAEQMLPYQLPLIKSMRLSGQAADAVPQVRELIAAFPDNASVIFETAEALAATGEPDNLRAARPHYTRLIQALTDGRGPMYWRAWVQVLSIADQLDEGTEQIAPRVRQLKKAIDPDLGGPPFNQALQALHDKHAG